MKVTNKGQPKGNLVMTLQCVAYDGEDDMAGREEGHHETKASSSPTQNQFC